MDWILIAVFILIATVVAVAVAVRTTPPGSQGAPGEVVADEPLSHHTGAGVGGHDHEHAGGAEDRPGGPAQEPMDPDALGGEHGAPPR